MQASSVSVLDLCVSVVSLKLLKPELLCETAWAPRVQKHCQNQSRPNPPLVFPSFHLLPVYPLPPPVPLFFPSSPFPKHEQFTLNSIFPRLGSHGTALEFRFVMIKWLHGIVFLRAPPSAFIRICQCRCRSASQSARLHRSSSPLRFPFPPRNWLFLMKYVAPGRRIIWLHPLD